MSELYTALKYLDTFYQIKHDDIKVVESTNSYKLQRNITSFECDLAIINNFCDMIQSELINNTRPFLSHIIRTKIDMSDNNYKFEIFSYSPRDNLSNIQYFQFPILSDLNNFIESHKVFDKIITITDKNSVLYDFDIHYYIKYRPKWKFYVEASYKIDSKGIFDYIKSLFLTNE